MKRLLTFFFALFCAGMSISMIYDAFDTALNSSPVEALSTFDIVQVVIFFVAGIFYSFVAYGCAEYTIEGSQKQNT